MSPITRVSTVLLCAALACSAPLAAHAQAPAATSGWSFAVTPYAWLPGLQGNVGVGPLATTVSLNFSQVLRRLQFAAMGSGQVNYGPAFFSIDALYVGLGGVKTVAFRGDTGSFSLTAHQTILQPMVGYTLGNRLWAVDLLAGIRYWHISADLTSNRPSGVSVERSGSREWADALGGLRARWTPKSYVTVAAGGDLGAGGADDDWQAYGLLGANVWHDWTVSLAYRYLSVNYTNDAFLYDASMMGFVVGATYKF